MMTSSGVIMPRSPWLASAACTKKAGVPVEAKRRRDLAADMARLAEPGDDDAALGVADQVDGGGEGRPERALQRGRDRGDAAGFRIERAQGRLDGGARVVGAG